MACHLQTVGSRISTPQGGSGNLRKKKNNKLENEQTSRGRSGHSPKTNMTMEHPHFGYRGPASSKGEFLFQLEAM